MVKRLSSKLAGIFLASLLVGNISCSYRVEDSYLERKETDLLEKNSREPEYVNSDYLDMS